MSGTQVVTFDYPTWAAMFPELAVSVAEPAATMYFGMACAYVDNTPCTLILNTTTLAAVLNMTTAHLAQLLATQNGQPASPLVGRIATAAEGSVNVAVEMQTPPTAAWWMQTKYGALAWQALAPWRTSLYIAAPQIPLAQQSYPYFLGGGGSASWRP